MAVNYFIATSYMAPLASVGITILLVFEVSFMECILLTLSLP